MCIVRGSDVVSFLSASVLGRPAKVERHRAEAGGLKMDARSGRERGYYWITWSDWAGDELRSSRPDPLIGEWDGQVWWFARRTTYCFDSEVMVLGLQLTPPRDAPQSAVFRSCRFADVPSRDPRP